MTLVCLALSDSAPTRSPAPHPTVPAVSRERSVAIALRTAHLLATSMYAGGLMANASAPSVLAWRRLTTATGSALLVTEVMHSRNWPHQGRGIVAMAHIGLLAVGHLDPRFAKGAAVTALVLGSVGSHLPRSVRKWSVLTRSVLP